MIVRDIIRELHLNEYQRIKVYSRKRGYGLILISGGYASKVIKYAGDREVIETNIHFDSTSINFVVEFRDSDLQLMR